MIQLEPRARVDTFRLIRPLGKGGFAEVWEAQNETDGRRVALKVLTEARADTARALERFEQEGRLAASLSSPRCVYVFGAGAVDGYPYIAMELMPGGTLADRIGSGPLGSREAVDCVLDVLDGLEAAQRQGILHRDVKPSNVFLDADGRAKIGDFGISKSLEADSKLSQTGAFLGTPYYASPEQIAAEPLDLRSDLYSVGAMLYELVTGKLPYQGTNASQVLAQVLTREPVPFAETGVRVPGGVQQVILRLLAKERQKRYQTYEEVREALVPFSSRGLTPAPLPRRFGAIFIDLGLIFLPFGLILGTLLLRDRFRGQLALSFSLHLSQFLYFTLTERYGGASVGKRLLGLRVTTTDGAGPSLAAVAARTLIFLALYAGPGIVLAQLAARGVTFGSGSLGTLVPALSTVVGLAAIVIPMRAKNGYAGAHELLTGTRVKALAGRDRAALVVGAPLAGTPEGAGGPRAYGPYHATGGLWSTPGESLAVARDDVLNRDVWIHVGDAAGLTAVDVLRERGPGSLPWLQRGTSGAQTWDAYGAPGGTSLTTAARGRGLDWRRMRVLLRSLLAELQNRFKDGGTAGVLSPDHVWIDAQGHALLLDFPASGPSAPGAGPAAEVTPATWQAFVTGVVALGLRDLLPEHARTLLDGLTAPAGSPSIDAFAAALDGVAGRPARVTPLRRAGPLAVLAIVPVGIVFFRLVVPVFMTGLPPWYQELALNAPALIDSLRSAEDRAGNDSTARRTAEAIRVVLARDRMEALLEPQIGKPALGNLPPRARAEIDSAAGRYPSPDSATVAAARAWLTGKVRQVRLKGGLSTVPGTFIAGMKALGYLGVVGVVLALALRGGLLFTLFGVAVQHRDGTPAGRLRCFARSVVAWGPLLGLVALGQIPRLQTGLATAGQPTFSVKTTEGPPPSPTPAGEEGILGDVLIVLALGGAAVAVWRPARGIAERIAGVVLVPK